MSVGLAVFNGDNYLAEALESILDQSFSDFELIVSDNASTDRTAEIVQHFMAVDPRVRYHRNETNIGGARNENRTFRLAQGRYFKLAAHDDRIAPTLLEECLQVLETQQDVVLAYSMTIEIDDLGVVRKQYGIGRGMSRSPARRFMSLAFRNHACEPIYGLIRSETLALTHLQEDFVDSDRVLLCELSMHGRFVEIDRPLFYKRQHAKNRFIDWRARTAWYLPSSKGRPSFPNWRELQGLGRVVVGAPSSVGLSERVKCGVIVLIWAIRYSPHLAKDIVTAALLRLGIYRTKFANDELYNWE